MSVAGRVAGRYLEAGSRDMSRAKRVLEKLYGVGTVKVAPLSDPGEFTATVQGASGGDLAGERARVNRALWGSGLADLEVFSVHVTAVGLGFWFVTRA